MHLAASPLTPARGLPAAEGLLLVSFFLSGCSALIYQVGWQRALYAQIGVDIDSTTIIVSVFMLGIGVGAMLGGWLSDRWPRRRGFPDVHVRPRREHVGRRAGADAACTEDAHAVDTTVPAMAWANDGWRQAHPEAWRMLEANRSAPLMHMDVAPTLLGAAGIRYREPRAQPADLTARPVPPRPRFTQARPGATMSFEVLRQQAGLPVRAAEP